MGPAGGLPRGAGGIGGLLALTDVQYSSVIEGGLMAVAGPATGGESVALLAQSGASQAGGGGVTVPLADESGNGGQVVLDDVLAPGGGSELSFAPASESGGSTSQPSPVTMELVAVQPTGEQSLQLTFADGGGNVALGDFEIGEPQYEFYSYWYAYDANGNVGQVVDGWTGDTVAAYEYDAYGRTIAACGPRWIDNPFRFSTKFAEDDGASELVETPAGSGYYVDADPMYYYGYRYYLPRMGRWGSRDPNGSQLLCVYAFSDNAAVSLVDYLGLDVLKSPQSQPVKDELRSPGFPKVTTFGICQRLHGNGAIAEIIGESKKACDRAAALAYVFLNQDIFNDVIRKFGRNTPILVDFYRRAFSSNDLQQLQTTWGSMFRQIHEQCRRGVVVNCCEKCRAEVLGKSDIGSRDGRLTLCPEWFARNSTMREKKRNLDGWKTILHELTHNMSATTDKLVDGTPGIEDLSTGAHYIEQGFTEICAALKNYSPPSGASLSYDPYH
ncbi:MAG: RHS repeat-associated core domain-containing protein [Phycisphaerae bacterium]